MRLMGLRHDVVMKNEVKYLLFYDIDTHVVSDTFMLDVDALMYMNHVSYILYKTKNGYHIIGLTPLDELQWASVFHALKEMFGSYYGGIVIRLSRKEQEVQELVALHENYGEVIPNLYNLYCTRFNLPKKVWYKEFSKHLLVFEKYRTEKT